jgi:hypothetical protein
MAGVRDRTGVAGPAVAAGWSRRVVTVDERVEISGCRRRSRVITLPPAMPPREAARHRSPRPGGGFGGVTPPLGAGPNDFFQTGLTHPQRIGIGPLVPRLQVEMDWWGRPQEENALPERNRAQVADRQGRSARAGSLPLVIGAATRLGHDQDPSLC